MKENITVAMLDEFRQHLRKQEKSRGTIEKYVRDVGRFSEWIVVHCADSELSSETVVRWREYLQISGYAAITINSMLGGVNSFLRFLGCEDCRAKYLRIQHRMFRREGRQLSKAEYNILRQKAEDSGKNRLAMLMETICATGIRIGEVRYITIEAVKCGRTEITLKGKIRTILIPRRLARKLLRYAQIEKIDSGEIFVTRNGSSLSRKQVWAEMKQLCEQAGIAASKVFPHNLRHLFATTFYGLYQDIVRLADVLGHSSLETTRIYLLTTEKEHMRQLDGMGLVT